MTPPEPRGEVMSPDTKAEGLGVVAWRYGPDPWFVSLTCPRDELSWPTVEPLVRLSDAQAMEARALAREAGLRERRGVYVASRASIPERGQMWRDLRASGVNVTSSWIDEDGPGETADFADLWPRIEREVTSSERLICYLEPDDFPIKGVLIEIGMALAAKVPVVIVAPDIELEGRTFRPLGSWIKHPLVTFAPTIRAALSREGDHGEPG